MNDIFVEQLVKKEITKKDLINKAMIILGSVLAIFIVLVVVPIPIVLLILIIGEVFLIMFLFGRMKVEYEYVITNDILDIDVIYNKEKRKHVQSVDIRSIQIMAPVNNKAYENEMKKYDVLKDYSSSVTKDNTYAMIFKDDTDVKKIIIEPNEAILKAIKRYISRNLKQ